MKNKISFAEKKNCTIKSLKEVEYFLCNIKQAGHILKLTKNIKQINKSLMYLLYIYWNFNVS